MDETEDSDDTEDTREASGPVGGDLRSFGRRRGRKASALQRQLLATLLPAVAVDLESAAPARPEDLFSQRRVAVVPHETNRDATLDPATTVYAPMPQQWTHPVREAWLEIGFGGGEHLVWQADRNPGVGIIGCEPFEDGVIKVLTAIDAKGLRNVLVHADDVRRLLRWLPDASIARVFILFPDPWPKRRHAKRRLVNPHLVKLLARVMRPGAELRFATDIGDYLRTALLALNGSRDFRWCADAPSDWRSRTDDWPETRYERTALREGRRCYYLRFNRR